MAHVMLDGKTSSDAANPVTTGPVVRLNPLIQPVLASRDGRDYWILPRAVRGPDHAWGQFPREAEPALDDDRFEALVEMDMDATEDREVSLIRRFAEAWMADHIPNQPVRADGRLDCQIGHHWFSQGLSQAIGYFVPTRPEGGRLAHFCAAGRASRRAARPVRNRTLRGATLRNVSIP